MRRRISPIVMTLCTAIFGASAGYAGIKDFNALGITEGVPELQGFGGVALLTVIASVGYGARKVYQKIVHRDRE